MVDGWEAEGQGEAQKCKENLSQRNNRTMHVLLCKERSGGHDFPSRFNWMFCMPTQYSYDLRLDGWRLGFFSSLSKQHFGLYYNDTTSCYIMRYEGAYSMVRISVGVSACVFLEIDVIASVRR